MGSNHVVEQLLFSMIPSILTFEFDLFLGSFLTFLGPNRLYLCLGLGSKTVFGSTHVSEHFFKRRLVAFKGGFVGLLVGRCVCLQKIFKKF